MTIRTAKKILIHSCEECPCHIFDDQRHMERWGKDWCIILDKEIPIAHEAIGLSIFPEDCPMEDVEYDDGE